MGKNSQQPRTNTEGVDKATASKHDANKATASNHVVNNDIASKHRKNPKSEITTPNLDKNSNGTSVIIILVHGQIHTAHTAYTAFINNVINKLLGIGTEIIEFNWGPSGMFEYTTSIEEIFKDPKKSVHAVAKLIALILKIDKWKSNNNLNIPVVIASYSQGTSITWATLQRLSGRPSMMIDNWILMGSPLDYRVVWRKSGDTDLGKAAKAVRGRILNLFSSEDDVNTLGHFKGVGGVGIKKIIPQLKGGFIAQDATDEIIQKRFGSEKIFQAHIKGVDHIKDDDDSDQNRTDWLGGNWLKNLTKKEISPVKHLELPIKMLKGFINGDEPTPVKLSNKAKKSLKIFQKQYSWNEETSKHVEMIKEYGKKFRELWE